MKKIIEMITGKNDYLLVIILWIIFQTIWIAVFGINFKLEADKYIRVAHYLVDHHQFFEQRYWFYSIVLFILAGCIYLKLSLYVAVAIIMAINLICYLFFFKALNKIFSNKLPVYVTIFFLLFYWPYQHWSFTVFTEGVFYSFVMLLLSLLMLYKTMSTKFIAATLVVLLLLIFTRPLGMLFVIPVLGFSYGKLTKQFQKNIFWGAILAGCGLIYYVAQIVFTTTSDWSMMQAIQSDLIIADVENIPVNKNIIITHNSSQLYQLFFYITHNFGHFIYLACKRLEAFFFMYRKYYSLPHNVFMITPVILMYIVTIIQIKKIKQILGNDLLIFIFSSILFFALAVATQFDDYQNRFFLTLVPFFTLLLMVGLANIMQPKVTHQST